MNDQSGTAQLRFLEETAIRLRQNGFTVEPIEDHHLPVCWEKGRLCRISGKGSVLYRQENVDSIRAQDALHSVIDTAKMTSEYMVILEYAPQLKAGCLVGDYRILAAFNAAGWTYRIDFDYISELSKQLNMNCIGATNYSRKTICLSEASATLHEFGHFLDGQLGFPAEHEQLYLTEAQNSGLREYAKTNARESFADCFDYWITYSGNEKRMETFRNAAPQTWTYFEALEKNNWRDGQTKPPPSGSTLDRGGSFLV